MPPIQADGIRSSRFYLRLLAQNRYFHRRVHIRITEYTQPHQSVVDVDVYEYVYVCINVYVKFLNNNI